jgi:ribonuclease P protein component
MISCTFKKGERLSSQNIIGEIFLKGDSFVCYPLKVVWVDQVILNSPFNSQVAFSVPKKTFKKAHERNLIKRRMRESFRQLKTSLNEYLVNHRQKYALMIIFIGKEESSFSKIDSAMSKTLNRLTKGINSV